MDKVGCIVVGAGPAGAACAIGLARKGIETVLVERGQYAGAKNVASFILFADILERIIPNYRDEAPLERIASDTGFFALRDGDFMEFRAKSTNYYEKPTMYTAYRSEFDRWFAGKAQEEGVEFVNGMLVTGLLKENGRVVGVKVGDDELLANVVIGADGLHSVVARESGLYTDDTSRYMLGIKEVHDLPSEEIESRFQLRKGEGCIRDGWGYPVSDIGGLSTIYTLNDSITIVLFAPIDTMKEHGVSLRDRLEDYKAHPYIKKYLEGAKLREYEAHLIPEGGRLKLDQMYTDGVLLCGEAGGFNSSMWVGVPPGMLSGLTAAEAVARAKKRGRYDAEALSVYKELLFETNLPRMLFNARKFSDWFVTSARRNMEGFTEGMFDTFIEYVMEEVNFTDPKPAPLMQHAYENLVEPYLPKFLRKPAALLVKLLEKAETWNKMRKIRGAV